MWAPLLLFSAVAVAAPPAGLPVAVPDWLPTAVASVDQAMASVESGRRLKAGASDVAVEPRRVPPDGPAVVFEPGDKPVIGVDPRRARTLTLVQFELALARARARAARDAGVRLIEAEQAAEQAVLEYALDRFETSDEFKSALSKAAARVRSRARTQRVDFELAGATVSFRDLPIASKDPDREADLLARFADDPQEFYWALERELGAASGAVGLSELETFLWAYAERLNSISCPRGARYCSVEGRLVRPELVGAARAVVAGGGLDRLRETLGGFQGEPASRLRERVREWLKKA